MRLSLNGIGNEILGFDVINTFLNVFWLVYDGGHFLAEILIM